MTNTAETLTWGQDYSSHNWHIVIAEPGRMQRAACNSRYNVSAESGTDRRNDWEKQWATCGRCAQRAAKLAS